MKKTVLLALGLAFVSSGYAQEYAPLQITSGFNADVIANGTGPALLSTTESFDSAEFVLMATDYQSDAGATPPAYALPTNGFMASPTAGLSYQLAAYSGENALRLSEQFDLGILNIGNPVNATSVYVLASTGSGSGTLGGIIHFSDNSTQEITAGVIPDWFYSEALPVVASGFGRVGRSSDLMENPQDNPRLYQFEIAILPANQTKTITSIDFTKLSDLEGAINIFALSAQLLGTCPNPGNLTVLASGYDGLTVNWQAPAITPTSYGVYIFPAGAPTPVIGTVPTAMVSGTSPTTYTQTGLIPGTTYCVYIRSLCDPDIANFMGPVCTTTAQITTVSPAQIQTLFSFDEPTVSSATSCPGLLSVVIPAGFVIASVATQYSMQTASNGWMSEQRSLLVCSTSGIAEAGITSGLGNSTGQFGYSRDGLTLAAGLSGTVNFELRTWRTYGGSDCNSDYNYVVPGSWKVIVTLEAVLATQTFTSNSWAMHPNPAQDRVSISSTERIQNVMLYNMLGQQLQRNANLMAQTAELSIGDLPSGQYLVKVETASGMQTKTLLKK